MSLAEDLGKLSPEQLKALQGVISDAKSLTDRQAEIIEKVLAGEADIGKLRISYLKKYFDAYSASLDKIARKHSELNDAFLVLDKKISDRFVSISPAGDKHDRSTGEDKRKASATNSNQSSSAGTSANANNSNGGAGNRKPPSDSKKPADDLAPKDIPAGSIAVENKIDDESRDKMVEEPSPEQKRLDVVKFLNDQLKNLYKSEEEQEKDLNDLRASNDALEAARIKEREKHYKLLQTKQKKAAEDLIKLDNLRHQDDIDKAAAVADVRISKVQEVLDAEIDAQRLLNRIEAERTFYSSSNIIDEKGNDTGVSEAGALRARLVQAEKVAEHSRKMEAAIVDYRARRELEARRKNNGILSKEAASAIEKELAEKFSLEKAYNKKRITNLAKLEQENLFKAQDQQRREELKTLTGKGHSMAERKEAFYQLTHNEAGEVDNAKIAASAITMLDSGIKALSDLAKQLESKIDNISKHQGSVDTRLQGSSNKKYAGSYWNQLNRDMMSVGAVTPFFKQENFATNIESLVKKGIAFDLKQRAFLMTIQEKIADTFEVTNATLLRLVRVQQEDSTAGRLGMESALNSFLNSMYETSEYLEGVAGSVRTSLEEMESLIGGAAATELEFQVQKWLGSLYSVGMSQNAITSIADAFGKIGAGEVEGLTSGGAGNLLIMAANDAGLSIADILTDGINAGDTNKLLQATVNYLSEIAESTKDNRVVQQQLAKVFGVRASDLRAATNLVSKGSIGDIYDNYMSYDNMLKRLNDMAGTMHKRTSIAEMMTNLWENGSYTLASSMASNPASYLIYKMASVLDSAVGGIALPFINVSGFGVDLNTTVADLMRLGAMSGGILSSLGPMISGLTSSFSGQAMLQKMGISSGSGLAVTPRGGAGSGGSAPLGDNGGSSTSSSGYAGNASGSDVKNSTIQESKDSKKQQMIEAKEEEEANQVNILNTTVLKIYELLDDVAHGNGCFKVKVEGYGLTKASSLSNMAGVDALAGISGNTAGNTLGASLSGGGVISGGGGRVELGGWTTA